MMVIVNDKITLLELIQQKRIDMLANAKNFGRTHPVVLKSSQELDSLLNQYQKNTSITSEQENEQ